MHLQGHFGVSGQKAMADGCKLQQEKVLLDIGKNIFISGGIQHRDREQRDGGTSVLGDI